MKTDQVQTLLMEVRMTGSARIDKKILLWMLGRQRDHSSVWPLLLNEWEEIGGKRDQLQGLEYGSYITLVAEETGSVKVDWAGE